jgi:foldase protein PrsA
MARPPRSPAKGSKPPPGRTIGLILLACIVAIVAAAIFSATGGVADDDVADVEDAGTVSKTDFNHWLEVVSSQPQPGQKKKPEPPKPGSRQYDAVKQQVMQFLVSAKWIEGEAKDRGLSASPAEVDRQFEETKDQSFPSEKAYKRFLRSSGQTEEDLKFRVRLDVLSNKIRQQVTESSQNVSEGEIEDYYNDNAQQFSQPERRDLEVVLSKKQADVLEAKRRVEGGERWSKVARELSDDPASKEQGGKLLGVTKGQQDPKLDAAVFAAVEKKVAGPIKTDAGYYVFRVTKITKSSKQSLEQSQQGIRQLLVSQKQQEELDSFSKDFRNDWRARTDCADDYKIADCRNGREEDQAATPPLPPGQKQPIPGSTGANPPALDGTGSSLAGGDGGDTVIGIEQDAAGGQGQLGLPGGGGAGAPQAALALGGAPKAGAAGAQPGGAVPGGVPTTPGGAGGQPVPQQGGQQQGAPQQGAPPPSGNP